VRQIRNPKLETRINRYDSRVPTWQPEESCQSHTVQSSGLEGSEVSKRAKRVLAALLLHQQHPRFSSTIPIFSPSQEYHQPTIPKSPSISTVAAIKSRRCLNIPSTSAPRSPIMGTPRMCGIAILFPMIGPNS